VKRTFPDGKSTITAIGQPDPFAAYRVVLNNTTAGPLDFDAFAHMPILPIVGANQVFARVDVTLTDTGGAPGASLEPLFFSNMFETFVAETELGGLTDAGAALGSTPITTLGLTSLTTGPLSGPDPTLNFAAAWNYLVPFVNIRLSAGDTVEIFGILAIVEGGQPLPDADDVFARLAAVQDPIAAPGPHSLVLLAAAGAVLGLLRGRRPRR